MPHSHSRSTDKISDTDSEQRVSDHACKVESITTGLFKTSKVIRGECDDNRRCIDSLSHTYSERAYQVYLVTRFGVG